MNFKKEIVKNIFTKKVYTRVYSYVQFGHTTTHGPVTTTRHQKFKCLKNKEIIKTHFGPARNKSDKHIA